MKTNIDYNTIARRAYELYLERGCQDGFAEQDWLRAEAELNKPTTTTQTKPETKRKEPTRPTTSRSPSRSRTL